MDRIYYNPKVYTPVTHMEDVREIKPTNSFYKLYAGGAYESYDDAIKDNSHGYKEWWDKDKLMKGLLVPEWLYEICPDNGVVQWNINWGDIIGLTKKDVVTQYKKMFPDKNVDKNDINYDKQYGVYKLHVHYDGRY